MELNASEQAVLDRFREKCRIAGGPKPGYNMRRDSICFFSAETPDLDLDGALALLAEKGLLKPNETGDRFILTAAGAELLSEPGVSA